NTTLSNLSSTANLFVGMGVSGPGIQPNTTVTAIASGTSVTLSAAATATQTGGSYTFSGFVITFGGSLAGVNVNQIGVANVSGGPTFTLATSAEGGKLTAADVLKNLRTIPALSANEVQIITRVGNGGATQLSFN